MQVFWNKLRGISRSFTEIIINDSSYSWWCKPISIYEDGFNWFNCIDINGDRQIYKFNLEGGSINSQAFSDIVDEHSTAAILPLHSTNEVLVAFCGHNTPTLDYFKISQDTLQTTQIKASVFTGGAYSYTQLIQSKGKIFCFSRNNLYNWSLAISEDNGVTFGSEIDFITKDISIDNKLYLATQKVSDDKIKIGCYNHPLSGSNNVLTYLEINTITGEVSSLGSVITNIYSGFTTIQASALTPIYTPATTNDRFRFLDIASDGNHTYFAIAEFLASESSDYRSGNYKVVVLNHSDWTTSIVDITPHGKDSYITYFGGVYFVQTLDGDWNNDIYLSREDNEIWYIERWSFTGSSFVFEELIDELPSGSTGNSGVGLYRPQPPYNSNNSGAKLSYQKGNYFEGYTNWDNEIIIK